MFMVSSFKLVHVDILFLERYLIMVSSLYHLYTTQEILMYFMIFNCNTCQHTNLSTYNTHYLHYLHYLLNKLWLSNGGCSSDRLAK